MGTIFESAATDKELPRGRLPQTVTPQHYTLMIDAELATKLRSENGGAIAVDRTLERNDDCIALREKTGQAIHTTLAAELGVR